MPRAGLKAQAPRLDFFRFFFATSQSDSRQPKVEFGTIHKPKIAAFEDRSASKRKMSTKNDTTAFRYYCSNAFAEERVISPRLRPCVPSPSPVFQT